MVASTLLAACAVPRPKPVPPPPPSDFAVSLDVSSRVQPIYPGYDVIYALGGTTLLDAAISDTGSLVGLRIEQSSGHRELDRAATDAVRNWKFRPGNRGGYRVGGVVRIPLHFNPRPFFASVSSNPVVAVSSLCTRPGICAAREAQTLQGPAFASTP